MHLSLRLCTRRFVETTESSDEDDTPMTTTQILALRAAAAAVNSAPASSVESPRSAEDSALKSNSGNHRTSSALAQALHSTGESNYVDSQTESDIRCRAHVAAGACPTGVTVYVGNRAFDMPGGVWHFFWLVC